MCGKVLVCVLLALACLTLSACCPLGLEDDCECDETANLTLTNGTSDSVVVLVNGIVYGQIGPGGLLQETLGAGRHSFQFQSPDGSDMFCDGSVELVKCQDESFTCSGS